ncbi:MAG: Crp/Fnr family transcriptional regulator [Tenuifilaceae bacterium]|jgi:CRP-like cAMP-binding protein|nr:Crp/Fnr family transcriptional regulator [Bacteroidales bacterium]MDI9516236.1 Crp/Fnr family transcriptional regulator [Bacteroidota bacterium]NLH55602.1 Crp/Fnr family transcriptional regulator [Rikenellaceae bacterium]OQC64937.1 MAG: cAMP receptor protein [Bacteroidetes bacterium ADurb.Bin008]HNV80420.1 Crp/Fnr family transcriptional regulator [Tenuifilaceae bacterium]
MNNEAKVQILQKNWLFSQLSPQEIDEILLKTTTVEYRRKETIFKKGEFISHLVLLLEGYLKIEVDQGEKNFIFDIIPPLHYIGLPLVLSSEKYIFSAVSLTDTTLLYVPMDLVKKIMGENGQVAIKAIEYGNETFTFTLFEKLKSSALNNVRGRLAKLLLHFSTVVFKNNTFTLLIGRNEIAQMIGFSRENVIRTLSEFNTEGIIRIGGKTIEIIDPVKLDELGKYS